MNILILGGTAEARRLADLLVAQGHAVTTSLAGRTQAPVLPKGQIRTGGFGGVAGLSAYLRDAHIDRLVDATHPYAARISANAVAAARQTGIPLVRLMRPAWPEPTDAPWFNVQSTHAAAAALPPGARVLLTTGHTGLATFLGRTDCTFIVRTIEAPADPLPAHAQLLQARPPYYLDTELTLLGDYRITHLVTKNSGGAQTAAKLEAARQLGIPIVMLARPAYDPATEVSTPEAAITALALG